MLKSMTGFGAAAGEIQGVEFSVEIKSVNNRYLKIYTKLPERLGALEAKIEQILRRRLHRGSLSLSVQMKLSDDQAAYTVNAAALQSYMEQLRPLEVEANPMFRLDVGSLLQLPGVCRPPELDDIAEKTGDGLCELVDQAVVAMIEMRKIEGQSILEDLQNNARIVVERLAEIAGRTDDVVQLYHERLTGRVDELLAKAKVTIDADTLAREVAIFADRSDIAEEISRLGQHASEFDRICQADEPVGRKLDFLAQEMLREANTIASKSADVDITRAVVEIKTAIDRIKEQAANVE
ncbi:MAG: YicC family protein [Phycisphaerae bacterium]|nr:YicC family protein [Phycisphaerae bacterium]